MEWKKLFSKLAGADAPAIRQSIQELDQEIQNTEQDLSNLDLPVKQAELDFVIGNDSGELDKLQAKRARLQSVLSGLVQAREKFLCVLPDAEKREARTELDKINTAIVQLGVKLRKHREQAMQALALAFYHLYQGGTGQYGDAVDIVQRTNWIDVHHDKVFRDALPENPGESAYDQHRALVLERDRLRKLLKQ